VSFFLIFGQDLAAFAVSTVPELSFCVLETFILKHPFLQTAQTKLQHHTAQLRAL
jgi:hypothetical protein